MPRPTIAPFRLEYQAIGGTRPHKVRYFCDAVPSGDSTGYDFQIFGGGSVGMSAAINSAFPFWRALYPGTMSVGSVVLFQQVSGAWSPVASATNSNVGTNGGAFTPAQQTTVVLRGQVTRELTKHVYLECPFPYVGRVIAVGTLPAPLANQVNDLLDKSVGHQGSWVRTKANNFAAAFLSVVYDTNDRVRRDGGYA